MLYANKSVRVLGCFCSRDEEKFILLYFKLCQLSQIFESKLRLKSHSLFGIFHSNQTCPMPFSSFYIPSTCLSTMHNNNNRVIKLNHLFNFSIFIRFYPFNCKYTIPAGQKKRHIYHQNSVYLVSFTCFVCPVRTKIQQPA